MNMPKAARLTASLAAAAIAAAGVVVLLSAAPAPPLSAKLGSAPVVVELFTSQGCSSCPPADAVLRELARDPALRGRVIPLAFHVDYWNSLGWSDPFSSASWSERQLEYVRALGLNGSYTPQAVVSGAKQMVGSDRNALFAAIEAESKRAPEASIRLERQGQRTIVHSQTARAGLDLLVMVYEDDVRTDVKRGENGGRTLVNDGIVRDLERFESLPAGTAVREIPFAEPGQKKLGIVSLLQDPKTMRIVAAATMPLR